MKQRVTQFLAGTATVAGQEFRMRIRAGRWRWLLAAWFAVLAGFTLLMRLALTAAGEDDRPLGTPMYGALMLLVLGMGMLVVPALTAQSVNGDRERGTLATLQVTRLRPVEIAAGKLAAAWGTALVFLALTAPLVVWTVAEGGVPLARLAVTTLVMALLLGVVCAVAQALSSLLARSTTSAVLSYLTVFALTVGTLIVFGLATSLTTERVTVEAGWDGAPEERVEITRSRPDQVWWLLAPNPFVVLADAAPTLPERRDPVTGEVEPTQLDPLGEIGRGARELRQPPNDDDYFRVYRPVERGRPDAVWPLGLGVNVLLGVVAFTLTTRRLRTPARVLPRGIRVA